MSKLTAAIDTARMMAAVLKEELGTLQAKLAECQRERDDALTHNGKAG